MNTTTETNDVRDTELRVFRVLYEDGTVRGYALEPPPDMKSIPIDQLDMDIDYVQLLQVYVFRTEAEATVFQEGLGYGGEDTVKSVCGTVPKGWAVLREVDFDDVTDAPSIQVLDYRPTLRAEAVDYQTVAGELFSALTALLNDLADAEDDRHPETGQLYANVADALQVVERTRSFFT